MQNAAADLPIERYIKKRVRTSAVARGLIIVAVTAQVAHLVLHLLVARPTFRSDMLQAVAAAISAYVCYYKSRFEARYRQQWIELGIAFSIWTVAEIYYGFSVLKPGVIAVPFSDALWLIYAYPLLLVASYTPESSRRDVAGWLDAAQACAFFTILIGLFFPAPGIISQEISDDVQGVALFLVIFLRLCITAPGKDRLFFRNLTTYMGVYVVFCILYYAVTNHGVAVGSIAELCWSLPFTFFSVLVLRSDLNVAEETVRNDPSTASPVTYMQGISALGIAVMSMAASAVLAYHRPALGGTALAVTFALFAARTSAREWQLNAVHFKLNYSALHDPLTSIANRTLVEAEIARRIAHPPAEETELTVVLFVGLDRFKMLNDCLGHSFGDLLLKRVAEILAKSSRKRDLVARYGGDEFVILLRTADALEAQAYAERILDQLRRPLQLGDRLLYITASIGFVTDANHASAEAMMQDAHFAMHHAKKCGRDRAQAFEAEMIKIPQNRFVLEADLRSALKKDEISVHYQPIFDVDTETIQGFEALARWHHPERGSVSPGDFIPMAEDTGMIVELGLQVMRKACLQCKEWNDQFGTRYTMNVNVSAHQFANPDIFNQIVGTLRETGLEPKLLKLEMTESVLLSGYHAVGEVLENASAMGIQICLDDFGTGYSSLSYLVKYPFDVIKIDQSFVRNMDRDARKADVVRMLVGLAGSLNKHLVAEGVETRAEMDRLREFGCELVQGFLLSRPLTIVDATALMAAQDRKRLARTA